MLMEFQMEDKLTCNLLLNVAQNSTKSIFLRLSNKKKWFNISEKDNPKILLQSSLLYIQYRSFQNVSPDCRVHENCR